MPAPRIEYRSIDGTVERATAGDAKVCGECDMALKHGREYHPFAACLMFKGCGDGAVVRGNLEAVIRDAWKAVDFGGEETPDAP